MTLSVYICLQCPAAHCGTPGEYHAIYHSLVLTQCIMCVHRYKLLVAVELCKSVELLSLQLQEVLADGDG